MTTEQRLAHARHRAQDHLADAVEAHDQLASAFAFKPRDYDLIGRLKSAERFHLGAAQVYAALAAAEATSTLATAAASPSDDMTPEPGSEWAAMIEESRRA